MAGRLETFLSFLNKVAPLFQRKDKSAAEQIIGTVASLTKVKVEVNNPEEKRSSSRRGKTKLENSLATDLPLVSNNTQSSVPAIEPLQSSDIPESPNSGEANAKRQFEIEEKVRNKNSGYRLDAAKKSLELAKQNLKQATGDTTALENEVTLAK